MSEQNDIKALGDTLRTDWEEMKRQMDRKDADATAAVERVNAAIGATEQKINDKVKDLELKIARIEQLERPSPETKDEPSAEVKAFRDFFQYGDRSEHLIADCFAEERRAARGGRKALATDSDAAGGYTVPAPMEGAFIRRLIEFSPVRSLVSVVTITQGNAWVAPKEGATNFAAGKVGERDSRSETTAGDFALERIPVNEFYANPFVTQTMLDDSGFDVEGWISERVGTRRSVLEGGYHISGTGEGEPEGLLTHADIDAVASGDADEVTADGLIDLTFDLPASYARNASFLWHRTTTAAIRKLKDVTSGQYLWQPGINGGTSPTVLGYSYTEAIDMPVQATDAYAVLFGDFKATYRIVDRKGMTLMRDPFSSKPFIEMYFTWRTGGQVVLAEAMRKLKCDTAL